MSKKKEQKKELLKQEKEKIKKYRLEKFSHTMLIIQLIGTVIFLIILVIALFKKELFPFVEIMGGILLLLMAYNNQITYKRKNLTIVYALFGVMVIVTGVLTLIGVI